MGELVELGYPLGSHAWPMFSGALSSLDAFYVWTPSVAVAAAMLALVAFAALRRLSAMAWSAAFAAALVPAGYLTFSFIVQGSAKEVMTAVAVYGAIVVAADVFDRGLSIRRAPLLAIAPLAAFLTFGVGRGRLAGRARARLPGDRRAARGEGSARPPAWRSRRCSCSAWARPRWCPR